MSSQERYRPGRPETRVVKINLAVEDAVRCMFSYGLPRKKRKGTSSTSDEPVKIKNRSQGSTAGTHSHGARRMRP